MRSRWGKILLIVAAALVVLTGVLALLARKYADPYLRGKAIELMEDKFHGDAELKDIHVTVFPVLRIEGSGLAVHYQGRTDIPPLVAIEEFSAESGLTAFMGKPWKINNVHIKKMTLTFAPRQQGSGPRDFSKTRDIPVLIDRLECDDTELDILPKDPDKPVHDFQIHKLVMHSLGMDHAAPFTAELTNYAPPGEIATKGTFGPWKPDDPRQTPVSAEYTYTDADLGVFKGISGIMSSTGKFGGPLEELGVEGETRVPDFALKIAGHPMLMTTKYSATVDGTNGNTLLHPVIAQLLRTTIIAQGEVAKRPGDPGRTIALDVTIDQGRIEDLMKLAVKSEKPPLTGAVKLHTTLEIPPGKAEITKKLKLAGTFGISGGKFTSQEVRDKLETLSRKGQGKPEDEDAGSSISDLKGKFALGGGVITFRDLSFQVTGAKVLLAGTYNLDDEQLDFHGKLRLDAKLSDTMTGVKSFILKAFDPFFRKGNITELPIKITGPRDHPNFGLDFHHKDDDHAGGH